MAPRRRFTQNTILTWPAPDGAYVLAHQEALFYCLDTLPILLCFATYILAHPGYLLPPLNPRQQAAAEAAEAAPEAGQAGQGSESPSLGKDKRLPVAAVA